MPNIDQLNQAIDKMMSALSEFKKSLVEDGKSPRAMTATAPNITAPHDDYDDFESLKAALLSDKWPEAVNPNMICHPDNESDKLERGRGIIEMLIEEDLKGLKILDFGCGEGQCSFVATEYEPTLVCGYDIKSFDTWNKYKHNNLIFTSNFSDVSAHGPYDIVILFDVLDHLKEDDPTEVLSMIRSVLADNGKIYMRCHPFVSRHGTHLYHELNKAYAHLVFTPTELSSIVPQPKWCEPSIGVVYPIRTYTEFIKNARLEVTSRRDITEKVEPFFKIPKIAQRIIKNTNSESFPEFQMSLQFVDFTLHKPH